jgi:hypothetical protein
MFEHMIKAPKSFEDALVASAEAEAKQKVADIVLVDDESAPEADKNKSPKPQRGDHDKRRASNFESIVG